MITTQRMHILSFILSCVLAPCVNAQSSSILPVTLEGHVLLPSGAPLPGAVVAFDAFDVQFTGPRLVARTTDEGAYRLVLNVYGRIRLRAYKPSAGYPDTQGVVFSTGNEKYVELNLIPGSTLSNVDIHLGDADGTVHGTVRDSAGRLVPQARITISRAEDPRMYHSAYLDSDGSFTFSLPPRPIRLQISAPGFKTWKYVAKKDNSESLVLAPSAHEAIDVIMEPSK